MKIGGGRRQLVLDPFCEKLARCPYRQSPSFMANGRAIEMRKEVGQEPKKLWARASARARAAVDMMAAERRRK
jgi:hypothetical protein